jgi:GWxTD domain-containing protein
VDAFTRRHFSFGMFGSDPVRAAAEADSSLLVMEWVGMHDVKIMAIIRLMNRCFAMVLVMTLTCGQSAYAQNRVRYEQLAASHRDPVWHARTVALPHGTDSLRVLTSFRIDYAAIPFRRIPGTDSLRAVVGVTFDYVTHPERPSRRRDTADPPVGLGREVWIHTLTVSTDEAASGSVSDLIETRLPAARFRVMSRVEIDGVERTTTPGEPVTIERAALLPLDNQGRLLHLGSNIRFGEPASFRIFTSQDARAATYRMYRLNPAKTDSFELEHGIVNGDTLYPIQADLRNQPHRIHLFDSTDNRLGGIEFLPRWYDMPIGLLNLDLAIDLMRFTMNPVDLRALRRGSQAQREEGFHAWWAKRDPTPETPYNELMAEYYKRIHDAFLRFSSPAKAGYESDMGAIWIRYGEPLTVERRMPPGGTALEVWDYGNRRFIFRATTGFGDFELLSTP